MPISTAVDPSRVARAVGILAQYQDFSGGSVKALQPRVALLGQGNTGTTYSSAKRLITGGAAEVGSTYGYGSPLHLAALELLPPNGDGIGAIPLTVYPLVDGTTAATGSITPSGVATGSAVIYVVAGGIRSQAISIVTGDSVAAQTGKITAAIAATTNMPVTAVDGVTDVDLTAKWKGASGNLVSIEIEDSTGTGVTYAVAAMAAGAGDPAVETALALMGEVWETHVVNCLGYSNTTALGKIFDHGDARWGALTRRPYTAMCATAEANAATLITAGDLRKTDRVNVILAVPGSRDFPARLAARAVARVAVLMGRNPPTDYAVLPLSGISPGLDSVQFSSSVRDQLVKAGISTTEVRDSVVVLSDTVTLYHPTGEDPPAYRYVVDIAKLQVLLYNLGLEFDAAKWAGAPLIPDDQPTTNPNAKKPRTAKGACASIVDAHGLAAILSDTATTIPLIQAEIDAGNPKRLNLQVPVKLSGNSNVISLTLNFGFYFGVAA